MLTQSTPWYFDGFNVLHAVLLGRERDVDWWQREFQTRVVQWVEGLLGRGALDGPATIVFDAREPLADGQRVTSLLATVVYAPSADDFIVSACGSPEQRPRVVTADRSLGDRAKAGGARIVKPWHLDAKPQASPHDAED